MSCMEHFCSCESAGDTPLCTWQQPHHLQVPFCQLQQADTSIGLEPHLQCSHVPVFEQVCEGLLAIETTGTDFSSSSSGEDPDWESDEKNITESTERLQKNFKERQRVKKKREWLRKLVILLKKSKFIRDADKKKRFTEAYTVSLTTYLIMELEKDVARLGGKKRAMQSLRGVEKKKKKKTSNAFIHFSKHYRPNFVRILREAMESMDVRCTRPIKNPSQKVVQKLAAEAWNRLPPSAKNTNVQWEKYWSEPDIEELARGVLSC